MTKTLELRLLGNPQIIFEGQQVHAISSFKSQALLFYLAMIDGKVSRVALAGLLWADKSDDEARVNLRQALRQVVKVLPDSIIATRDTLAINAAITRSDVQAFLGLVEQDNADKLAEAADLYLADFLEGFYIENAPGFEAWQVLEQERLRERALQVLNSLVAHFVAEHDLPKALEYSKRFLSIEPFHEESQRRVMRLMSLQGNDRLALLQYTHYQKKLHQELGLQPSLKTIDLYQRIKRMSIMSLPELPPEHSPLVGRSRELADVTSLLNTKDNRLITLLGIGGVGKTRFALAVARQQQGRFLEGIYWINLAEVISESLVAASIATALGVNLAGNTSASEQLLAFLTDKELLLVLDNFEHLLSTNEAVDLVQSIWQKAAHVSLLVTSRVKLNLRAEFTYVIDQLSFPQMESVEANQIKEYEAVNLFEQVSSRAGKPLNEGQDIMTAGHICELLEGMPLAIEMAAALTLKESLNAIQTALNNNLITLHTSMKDVPQRQRSLQATFNYSLERLSQAEQTLLFKLSVFRGGFSLEAAQEVADASQVLLSNLVAHSLVRQGNNRYTLHEVIRQLAQDALAAQKAVETATRKKHRGFFAQKLERLKPNLHQEKAKKAMEWLTLELSNIHLAWQSAIETKDEQTIAKALDPLNTYYKRVGPASTADSLISEALKSMKHQQGKSEAYDLLLVKLSTTKARIQLTQHKFKSSETLIKAALKMLESYDAPELLYKLYLTKCRRLGDQGRYHEALPILKETLELTPSADVNGKIECLDLLGVALDWLGERTEAETYYREAYSLAEQTNAVERLATLNIGLGILRVNQGKAHQSIEHWQRAIHLFETLGDKGHITSCLINMGTSYDLLGDYMSSRQYYEKASNLAQGTGQQIDFYGALTNLGRAEHFLGRYDAAYTHYQTTRAYYQEKAMHDALSLVNANLALLAHNTGKQNMAVELSSASIELAEHLHLEYYALFGYLFMGHAKRALGCYEDALQNYQRVIDICRSIGLPPQEIEALAGQAHVALDQHNTALALEKLEPVLTFLEEHPEAEGAEEPLRLYLSSYEVLQACKDPRAYSLLSTGYELLMDRAQKLDDELKETYLTNVLVHKELTSHYDAHKSKEVGP